MGLSVFTLMWRRPVAQDGHASVAAASAKSSLPPKQIAHGKKQTCHPSPDRSGNLKK